MKSIIRNENKQKRAEMLKNDVEVKSYQASKIFLDSDIYKASTNLMLYMPLGNEISTTHIIKNAYLKGKTVLVPVTDKETYEISAHRIFEESIFEKGLFSLTEPKEKDLFDKSKIDTIIVPGIAFDKKGVRIGFGKGCYDKFLKNLSAIKIGYCYGFQLEDYIETDPFDAEMDYILTEKEFIKCK